MSIQTMSNKDLQASITQMQQELTRREQRENALHKAAAAAASFLAAVNEAVEAGAGTRLELIHQYMPQEYVDWVATAGVDIVKSIPRFIQPNMDAEGYWAGAQVIFEGKVYESLLPDNKYSPAAYPQGWKLLEGNL